MNTAKNFLIALSLCAVLPGCARIQEATLPVSGKVNAAFPVSADVQAAHDRLQVLLGSDAKASEIFAAETDSRMTVRALDCAKGLSIGRLDSVASVKGLPVDRDCLQERDRALLQFYGLRTIGVLLAEPPLRPRTAVGPISKLPRGRLTSINYGTVARDANVAVLRDIRNDAEVVELPGGRPIATLPRAMVPEPNSDLSPNGRVIAISPMGQSTTFYEAESGNRIWEASDDLRVLAWLPGLASFVYAARDGVVMIADGLTGTASEHPVAARNSAYGAYVPGGEERALLGVAHALNLVEHRRTEQGITATDIAQFRIDSGHGITSRDPVPMRSGKLVVFKSVRDIGWLDLERGATGVWETGALRPLNFAKLDETHLLITSVEQDRVTTRTWSFDIVEGTLAPVDTGGHRGLIVDIGDRVGFMLRGEEAWFGDEVAAGEAVPLRQLTRNFDAEVQLALARAQGLPEGAAVPPSGAERWPAVPAPAMTSSAVLPGLAEVPRDAQIHIVGVYEGEGGAAPAGSTAHPVRNVRVRTRASSRPMVLVLASYEPVNWIVTNSGARIAAVLLSGYHASNVTGIGNATVLRIGREYAYEANTDGYVRLRQAVAQYAGEREVRSFQGAYTGADFTVGGN
jgi:hypothetical protein